MEESQRKLYIWKNFDFKTSGIHKFSKHNELSNERLAISRRNGSLEIWKYSSKRTHWINQIIVNGRRNYLIESLIWIKSCILLSGDSDGMLIQRDCKSNSTCKMNTFHRGITCMDYCCKSESLVVGCEKGQILLFKCCPLTYVKSISVENFSISCICWHISGEQFLFATLHSGVYIHNVVSNTRVNIISQDTKVPLIIWSCLFLSDWTLVLAESSGTVQFWDGYTAVSLQNFTCHKADVLDLCVSSDESRVFSCSADRSICCFIQNSKHQRIVSRSPRYHHNDATCITFNTDYSFIISGGIDGLINTYIYDNSELCIKDSFGLYNQQIKYKISKNGFRIIYITDRLCRVYQLSKESYAPDLLVQINNDMDSNFFYGAISDCGCFVTLTTSSSIFLYKIEINHSVQISKISFAEASRGGFISCAFSADSKWFAFVNSKFQFVLFNIITRTVDSSVSLENVNAENFGRCQLYLFLNRFALFVVESYPTIVKLIDYSTGEMTDICCLSRNVILSTFLYHMNHLVLTDRKGSLFLIDVFNPHKMIRYKLNLKKRFQRQLLNGVFYDSYSNSLMFYSLSQLIKLSLPLLNNPIRTDSSNKKVDKIPLTYFSKYQPIIFSESFADGSLIILTKNLLEIYSSSLQPVAEKKFGRS